MWLLFASVLVILFCFGFVLLFGPPYLPTLSKQVEVALNLIDLKPGETLLELGCGDGKVLIAAAERGWKAVGYELNPILALVAWLRTRRYQGRVQVICGNMWTKQWPDAQGIFVFMLQRKMKQLDKKIVQTFRHSVKLVSFAFTIPGKEPAAQEAGVTLYYYNK